MRSVTSGEACPWDARGIVTGPPLLASSQARADQLRNGSVLWNINLRSGRIQTHRSQHRKDEAVAPRSQRLPDCATCGSSALFVSPSPVGQVANIERDHVHGELRKASFLGDEVPSGGQSERRQSRTISSRREQIVCRRPPTFSPAVSPPSDRIAVDAQQGGRDASARRVAPGVVGALPNLRSRNRTLTSRVGSAGRAIRLVRPSRGQTTISRPTSRRSPRQNRRLPPIAQPSFRQ